MNHNVADLSFLKSVFWPDVTQHAGLFHFLDAENNWRRCRKKNYLKYLLVVEQRAIGEIFLPGHDEISFEQDRTHLYQGALLSSPTFHIRILLKKFLAALENRK